MSSGAAEPALPASLRQAIERYLLEGLPGWSAHFRADRAGGVEIRVYDDAEPHDPRFRRAIRLPRQLIQDAQVSGGADWVLQFLRAARVGDQLAQAGKRVDEPIVIPYWS
jgi:hypothetical protein